MKKLQFAVFSLALSVGVALGATAPRKVACPAVCNSDEVSDSTQVCVKHDKDLYKVDGIGCAQYKTQCWCKPKPNPLPPVTVL